MSKLILLAALVLVTNNAMSDSFRCGRKLVKVGESSNALVKKCGNPVRKYSSSEMVYDNGRQKRAGVSNWVYQRRGKNDMIASVRSGRVIKLQVD